MLCRPQLLELVKELKRLSLNKLGKLSILIVMAIILTCLFYFYSINTIDSMKSNSLSDIEKYIQNQVEISNQWKWGDSLPLFVTDTTYDHQYYPEISKLGGLVQVAIIEKINNESLLLRLIIG